jgi:hypothetical protein
LCGEREEGGREEGGEEAEEERDGEWTNKKEKNLPPSRLPQV